MTIPHHHYVVEIYDNLELIETAHFVSSEGAVAFMVGRTSGPQAIRARVLYADQFVCKVCRNGAFRRR